MRLALAIGISILIILYFMDTDQEITKKAEPVETKEYDASEMEDWELTIGTSNKPFNPEKRPENNEYKTCKIDDYFWSSHQFYDGTESIKVQGTATCRRGWLTLNLHDGESEVFIGKIVALIDAYSFDTTIIDVRYIPEKLKLKYEVRSTSF